MLNPKVIQSLNAELAVNSPRFVKVHGNRAQLFCLIKDKLNLSYRIEAGLMHKLTKEACLHTNDRFFLNSTHCFNFLGHVEDSNQKQDPQKFEDNATKPSTAKKVLLGDDLGAEAYAHGSMRLDFTDVPYLNKYGIRPFVFGELIYYPPYYAQGAMSQRIKQHTRGGIGFGIAIPLPVGDNINI